MSRHRPCGASGVGCGRSTGMLSNVACTSFMSCRLAPSMASPTGIPEPSVSRLRFAPCFPRSVGFGPVFGFPARVPCSWCHPWTARTNPAPSTGRTRAAHPATTTQKPRPQSIPRTVGAPNCSCKSRFGPRRPIGILSGPRKRIASIAERSGTPGLCTPHGCGFNLNARVPASQSRHSITHTDLPKYALSTGRSWRGWR